MFVTGLYGENNTLAQNPLNVSVWLGHAFLYFKIDRWPFSSAHMMPTKEWFKVSGKKWGRRKLSILDKASNPSQMLVEQNTTTGCNTVQLSPCTNAWATYLHRSMPSFRRVQKLSCEASIWLGSDGISSSCPTICIHCRHFLASSSSYLPSICSTVYSLSWKDITVCILLSPGNQVIES